MKLAFTELIAWYKGKPELKGTYYVKRRGLLMSDDDFITKLYWDGKQWLDANTLGNFYTSDEVLLFSPGPKGVDR